MSCPGAARGGAGAAEPCPILARRDSEAGHEGAAHRLGTAEADESRSLRHAVPPAVEERLGVVESDALDELRRRGLELRGEQAGQVPRAHPHVPSERGGAVVERWLGGDQLDRRTKRRGTRRRNLERRGELRLTAWALHEHHQVSCHLTSHIGTVILLDERQGEVDPGRYAGRGVHAVVTDEERIRRDLDRRIGAGEETCAAPVSRGVPPIQQSGGSKDERAGTDRHQATALPRELLHGLDEIGVDRPDGQVITTGDDDRVDVDVQQVPARSVDSEDGSDGGTHVSTRRRHVGEVVLPAEPGSLGKNLGRAGDVEHLHAVEDDEGHTLARHRSPPLETTGPRPAVIEAGSRSAS